LVTIAAETEEAAPSTLVGYGPGAGPETGVRRRARPTPQPESASALRAAPFVRQLAKEKGIDLATITGTGPGGRITRSDVEAAAHGTKTRPQPPPAAPVEGERRVSVVGLRKAIARQMVRSVSDDPAVHRVRHL